MMTLPRQFLLAKATIVALAAISGAWAQTGPGQWVRTANGTVVDQLDLARKGDGVLISLREGPGKPVYASGYCRTDCGKTLCAVRTTGGKVGLVELTSRGTGLHYRSFYDDGATVWEGDFTAGAGSAAGAPTPVSIPAAQPAPVPATSPAAALPGASQWIRTQGGTVVDVLTIRQQGSGYTYQLQEGFGRSVYSSGTCTLSGTTVTCAARTSSGKTGQIVLALHGSSLHYRSVFDAGRSVWEGDFTRSEPVR
ncbi:MAG: hypothetical protein HY821_06570 [Acidobacteria bacterium]|nr:hypothetical protein [Acidobacteriota bacterium]